MIYEKKGKDRREKKKKEIGLRALRLNLKVHYVPDLHQRLKLSERTLKCKLLSQREGLRT